MDILYFTILIKTEKYLNNKTRSQLA